jgi:hypothetical protein
MKPGDDVICAENVSVNDGNVLLAIAVVPKGDDAEATEARWEVRNGFDLHADVMNAEAVTIVVAIALDEVVQSRDRRERLDARNVVHGRC